MNQRPPDHLVRMARVRLSLEGLSLGDAFGERFFRPSAFGHGPVGPRTLPSGPWYWTDDTAMALSIVATLDRFGGIDQDFLAQEFAHRYRQDPARGYGGGAHELLQALRYGVHWK